MYKYRRVHEYRDLSYLVYRAALVAVAPEPVV